MGTTADKLNKLKDTKARIKAAIEAKGVSNVGDVFGEYPDKIAAISSGGGGETKWTGHADAEGLKAIGWTDEDIQYFQTYGVNWNEEDDEYHKVPQSNIDLYGVINENNIKTYKDILVYLPKIEITKTDLTKFFYNLEYLVSIPMLDTSNVTIMYDMFYNCYSLTTIPQLNTSNVTDMIGMFSSCQSFQYIPLLNTSNVTLLSSLFNSCTTLTTIPNFDISNATSASSLFSNAYCINNLDLNLSKATTVSNLARYTYSLKTAKISNLDNAKSALSMFQNSSAKSIKLSGTSNITTFSFAFDGCKCLETLEELDVLSATDFTNILRDCILLRNLKIKNLKLSIDIHWSPLTKESVLYIINNSIAESPITITLKQNVYDAMSADAEVQAALEAKPNVSLAGA